MPADSENYDPHRRLRLRAAVYSIAAFTVFAGAVSIYFWKENSARPANPAPAQGELLLTEISESSFNYGALRSARLTLSDGRRFAIAVYDFNAYYYTPGEDHAANEPVFLNVIGEHQGRFSGLFSGSWIVIFSGASFDGVAKMNLRLCRCRAWNVAKFLSRHLKIESLGYWAIAAGEFRLRDGGGDDFAEDSSEIEAEEDEEAKRLGEEGLTSQRRLLVTIVTPLHQSHSAEQDVTEVTAALAGKGFFPTGYDRGRSNPVMVDLAAFNDPCQPERTVKSKLESMLKGLFGSGN
jgi:hypothetical protein